MPNSIIDRAVQSLFSQLKKASRLTSRNLWSRSSRFLTGAALIAVLAFAENAPWAGAQEITYNPGETKTAGIAVPAGGTDVVIAAPGTNPATETGDITGTGPLTFTVQSGVNDPLLQLRGENTGFTGTVDFNYGTLNFAESRNLFGTMSKLSFNGNATDPRNSAVTTAILSGGDVDAAVTVSRQAWQLPTLQIDAGAALTIDGTGGATQRMVVTFGNAGSFDLQSGASLKFSNNVSDSSVYGGALNVESGGLLALTRDSSAGRYEFSGNTAGYGGGLANQLGYLSLTGADFTGNTANSQGGAFYNSGTAVLTDSVFSGNMVTGPITYGGAIYNSGTLTLTDASFTGNFVNGSLLAFGGAIWNGAGTVNLNVSDGKTSLFSGNVVKNMMVTSANSITFANPGNSTLRIANDGVLDMRDPMNKDGAGTTTIAHAGGGTWKLGGTNAFSTGTTRMTVESGTLYLYRADEVANPNSQGLGAGVNEKVKAGTLSMTTAGSSFTLGTDTAGARLNVGGGNSIATQTLTLKSGSTLGFDFKAATVGSSMLTLAGTTITIGTGITVDLLSPNSMAGTYTLVQGGDFSGVGKLDAAPTYQGQSIAGTRLDGLYILTGNNDNITLKQTADFSNKNVTWNGGATGDWDITTANWYEDGIPATPIKFFDGDAVTFATTEDTIVNIQGTQKTVSGMIVNNTGNLTINGNIVADSASSIGVVANTGKLVKSNTGTLTLNGANEFKNGVEMTGGTVVLGHNQALGSWTAGSDVAASGGVLLTTGASTIQVDADRTIRNHFQLGTAANRTGKLAFVIAPGKTLRISGVENTSTNNYLGRGGALTVNVPGANATTSPLSFTDGHLVFSDNSSYEYGGAVGAYFNGANQPSVLDFRGLESLTLTGNIAGNAGYGSGGGIYSYSCSSSSSSVSLGDFSTLTGNIAGNAGEGAGGGIFSSSFSSSSSSVALGAHATLTGNIAGNAGPGSGGGIFSSSSSSSSSSSVELGAPATLTGNIAGNADYGSGGGIFSSSSYSFSSSSVSLGDFSTLTGNIAGNAGYGDGGGIFSFSSSSSSSVALGAHATLTGNIAGNAGDGDGGGIFSSSYSSSSSVALGTGSYLTSNRAGGGNGGGRGGAIHVHSVSGVSQLSVSGDTYFQGNLVSGGGTNSLGGAVYIDGGAGSFVSLDAAAGDIAFSGNKIGVDTSDINAIDPTTGTANSIHLQANTKLDLKGSGNIYFDDPISSGTGGNNSLVKSGTGFVQFVGNNVLNTTDFAGTNSVDVQAGTFRVVNSGTDSFDATGAGAFNVAGTLAGQGTIKANGFTISGTLSPDGKTFQHGVFDETTNSFAAADLSMTAAEKIGTLTLVGDTTLDGTTLTVDIVALNSYDIIAVDGAVAFTGTNKVAAADGSANGTYDILTSTADMTLNDGDFAPITGTGADGYSYVRGSAVQLKNGNDKILQLKLDTTQNTTLTWTNETTNGNWSTLAADANWSDNPIGVATEKRFMTGDTVIFTDTYGATPGSIAVAAGGVSQNGMTIAGSGNWTFTGGAIGGSGGLTMNGSGTVTFTNDNTYAGATNINTGTLKLGDGGTTGSLDGTSAVTIAGGANLVFHRSDVFTSEDGFLVTNSVTGSGNMIFRGVNTANQSSYKFTGNSSTFSGTIGIENGARLILQGNVPDLTNSITVASGSQVYLASGHNYANQITISGNGWTENAGQLGVLRFGDEASLSGNVTLAGNSRITAITAEATISGIIDDGVSSYGIEKTGNGTLTLSGTNTYGGGTTVSDGKIISQNVGAFGSGGVEIKPAATVETEVATFGNALTGTGTFAANLATSSTSFTFGNTVGNGFTGTVRMMQGNIDLDNANNYAVLQNAALQLDANSSTEITQNRSIKGLTMNGGALKFDVTTIGPDGQLTVADLDTTGGGTIMMDVNKPIDTTIPTMENWYDYGGSSPAVQYRIVNATNSVNGDGTLLAWKDYQGYALGSQARTINDGAGDVGTATFGYAGTVDNKGILVGYTLTQLSADPGKTIVLDSTGAFGTILNAKLTGDGGFMFNGDTDVFVGNVTSDYTGATQIDENHTVTMLTDKAFGKTTYLGLTRNAKLDMNGKSQTVETATVASGTEITLGDLTLTQGGEIAGTLKGGATTYLQLTGGMTNITGDSSTFAGTVRQSDGTVNLDSATNLGGTFDQTAGTLNSFDGATLNNATFKGTVTPVGTLNVASVTFDGATVNLGSLTAGNIISSTSAVSFANTVVNVDAAGILADTTYTLIDYATSNATGVKVAATSLGDNRGGEYFTNTALMYDVVVGNTTLYWNGTPTAGTWNTTAENTNWSNGNFDTFFKTGDTVVFDGRATNKNVGIAADVTVAGMKVDAGDYAFSGGAIASTGTLGIATGSSATFSNAISFGGGIDNAGSLIFNPVDTTFVSSTIRGTGSVKLSGGELVMQVDNTSTGTFTLQAGTLHLNADWHGDFVQTGGELNTDTGRRLHQNAEFRGIVDMAGTLYVGGNLTLDGATLKINPTVDSIVVGNTVDFGTNNNTISLSAFKMGTDILLIDSGGMNADAIDHFNAVKLDSGDLNPRQSAGLFVKDNNLYMNATMVNLTLTWQGGDGLWINGSHWDGSPDNEFIDGDTVIFGNPAGTPESGTVMIGGTVRPVDMTMKAGTDYLFENGMIEATGAVLVEAGARMGLDVSNTKLVGETVTFAVGSDAYLAGTPVLAPGETKTVPNVITATGGGIDHDRFEELFNASTALKSQTAIFNAVPDGPASMDMQFKTLTVEQFANKNNLSPNTEKMAELFDAAVRKGILDEFFYGDGQFDTDAMLEQFLFGTLGGELAADAQMMALWKPWKHVYDRMYDVNEHYSRGYLGQCGTKRSNRELWGSGYYRSENVDSDGNAVGYDGQRGGVMVGVDTKLSSYALAGLAFGYGNPRASNGIGKIEADDYTFALYSKVRLVRGLYMNSFLGYGHQEYKYRRYAAGQQKTKYDGDSMYASVEFFRPLKLRNGLTLFPLFAVDFQKAWIDGFTETAPNSLLNVAKSDLDQTVLRIGLNSKYITGDRFNLRTRLQYGVQVGGDTQGRALTSLMVNPGESRMLTGVNLGRNTLNVGFGGDWYVSQKKRTRLFADYDFDLGENAMAHTGQLGFVTNW